MSLLELGVRCACHTLNCAEGIRDPLRSSLQLQLRNLFAVMCQLNSKAVGLYLTAFASLSPASKTLQCLHSMLAICLPSTTGGPACLLDIPPRSPQPSFMSERETKGEETSVPQQQLQQQQSETSVRKPWHNLLPDPASNAGEFFMNLTGRSIRGPSTRPHSTANDP